jgi:hypothetical protein
LFSDKRWVVIPAAQVRQIRRVRMPPAKLGPNPPAALHQAGFVAAGDGWTVGRATDSSASSSARLVFVSNVEDEMGELVGHTAGAACAGQRADAHGNVAAGVSAERSRIGDAAPGRGDPNVTSVAGRVVQDRHLTDLRLAISGVEEQVGSVFNRIPNCGKLSRCCIESNRDRKIEDVSVLTSRAGAVAVFVTELSGRPSISPIAVCSMAALGSAVGVPTATTIKKSKAA